MAFTTPPFSTVEDVNAETETNVEESMETVETVEEVEKVVPEKKKRNDIIIDSEKIDYVMANIKSQTYDEMAKATGLTKHQVNRILQTLKSGIRNRVLEADDNAYEKKTNKKGGLVPDYATPLTDKAKKAEKLILTKLCKSDAVSKPGGGGKSKQSLDSALDSLLAEL